MKGFDMNKCLSRDDKIPITNNDTTNLLSYKPIFSQIDKKEDKNILRFNTIVSRENTIKNIYNENPIY